MNGSTFKKCPHGKGCPDLGRRRHGSWVWAARLDTSAGRVLVRRGGFELERLAAEQLAQVTGLVALAGADDDARAAIGDMITSKTRRGGQLPDEGTVRRRLALGADPASPGVTVAEWMESWLAGRRKIRESVRRGYRSHIDLWITPQIGAIPLERLRAPQIDGLFAAIDRINAEVAGQKAEGRAWIHAEGDLRAKPKPVGVATKHRIFSTLRAALNTAVKQRMIQFNPALGVELESETHAEQPRWSAGQAAAFLAACEGDELALMFRIAVLRGLRRGELVGVRWADADLETGVLTLAHTVLQLGGRLVEGVPKTPGSERKIFLDGVTAGMLREHRRLQLAARLRASTAWQDGDLIFAREDGSPFAPDYCLRRFKALAKAAGVPQLTLHQGGRHSANSLMRDANVDDTIRMREVGHVTRSVSDRYTHTLASQHRDAAEATAALVDGAGA
jgi:integrase